MAVKAVFALAAVVAVTIALMLPVPHHTQETQRAPIPAVDVSQG